ncbi:efflux RND transporter periplasmic adaptor subunit [Panacibacter sp. KCS-6]|uniref:Efflux RND transporter periplasmic adaptor subunit n=1 Tax=Limnovirga soli TaxID=2656915 RepID=A0A8J8JX61_9BACT|nr:efflux RND transporter periplasmic adaptor subunit [Limnovirga soli]
MMYSIVITSLTIAMLASCGETQKPAVVTQDAIIVNTQPVIEKNYAPVLQYAGMIAAGTEAVLSFKIGGVVSRIYVSEGDHVTKGQLLATLDLTEINAQVQQSMQGLSKVQRDVNRVKNLLADTAATLEQYQNVQTQLSVASENLRIAQFNQQYAQIRAAQNGTIIKKIINEGELAGPGAPALILQGNADNDWVVRFGVSDKDWAMLQKGNTAKVMLDAYPETIFTGIVNKIAEAADLASGTYEVEIKVLPQGKKFAAGLFANITLQTSAQQNLKMIPIEALAEADGKIGYVYTLNADKKTVSKLKVNIAFIDKDQVAIATGLTGIAEVITNGSSYLTANSLVSVAQ